MDKFEKHIIKNRSKFDYELPDKSKLWKEIEGHLDTPKVKSKRLFANNYLLKIAASIVIILSSFFFIDQLTGTQNDINNALPISQELKDIDAYYQVMINNQLNSINESSNLSNDDKKEFLVFMDELDEEYDDLRNEMHKNLDSEKVMRAIINHYKKRIQLIEDFLTRINNNQKIEDENAYIL